jgi:hypothetical protein
VSGRIIGTALRIRDAGLVHHPARKTAAVGRAAAGFQVEVGGRDKGRSGIGEVGPETGEGAAGEGARGQPLPEGHQAVLVHEHLAVGGPGDGDAEAEVDGRGGQVVGEHDRHRVAEALTRAGARLRRIERAVTRGIDGRVACIGDRACGQEHGQYRDERGTPREANETHRRSPLYLFVTRLYSV